MEMREQILAEIQEGVLLTDPDGIITYMNRQSEEILGLRHPVPMPHAAGRLEYGDWLLIADTALGLDDGGLDEKDLADLGYKGNLKKGEGILLWCQYGQGRCFHQSISTKQSPGHLTLSIEALPAENHAEIDYDKQRIQISIGHITLEKHYKMAYGYMVILSPTGDLKFYQEDGYSIRKESIKDILSGRSYGEKAPHHIHRVIGQNIETCFVDLKRLEEGETHLINGIPVLIKERDIFSGHKPYRLYLLQDVTELSRQKNERDKALASLKDIKKRIQQQEEPFIHFMGRSTMIVETIRQAQRAAIVDSPVLISGESGTGKSLLAKEMHAKSERKNKPFIAVNCSSIPEALFESEMYGYVKGAFTGANVAGKIGYFEAASGGTLFLDEITELSLVNQAKLLHALQEKTITRLGSVNAIPVDVRIIAATNKNLVEAVQNRVFREDLYYRLNVIHLMIPPLRYRTEDIRLLALEKFKAMESRFPDHKPETIDRFIDALVQKPLFGNVRELENRIERFLAIGEMEEDPAPDNAVQHQTTEAKGYDAEMATFERRLLTQTIEQYHANLKAAYEALGMRRSTFYDRLKRLDIEIPKK